LSFNGCTAEETLFLGDNQQKSDQQQSVGHQQAAERAEIQQVDLVPVGGQTGDTSSQK
jgi:hypothetical protein